MNCHCTLIYLTPQEHPDRPPTDDDRVTFRLSQTSPPLLAPIVLRDGFCQGCGVHPCALWHIVNTIGMFQVRIKFCRICIDNRMYAQAASLPLLRAP